MQGQGEADAGAGTIGRTHPQLSTQALDGGVGQGQANAQSIGLATVEQGAGQRGLGRIEAGTVVADLTMELLLQQVQLWIS